MLMYPEIDPIALQLGPVAIRWYGLTYLAGFTAAYLLLRHRLRTRPSMQWLQPYADDLLFYLALGVVVGGRVGYMVFYQPMQLLHEPLSLFYVWQGGMSFHGGFLGVCVAIFFFAKKHRRHFLELADIIAPLAPLGLGFGRIGNFIGGELYGRVTQVPWGMVFPAGGPLPRHPSQLYQAFLEGLVLFIIVWWYSSKPRPWPSVSGVFLIGYAIFRMSMEQFRQPDQQLNFIAWGWLTMGQLLSIPMFLVGVWVVVWAHRKRQGVV
jgi:phosphatidylglycerol:prolipoprotein diacylglycerol transferase